MIKESHEKRKERKSHFLSDSVLTNSPKLQKLSFVKYRPLN